MDGPLGIPIHDCGRCHGGALLLRHTSLAIALAALSCSAEPARQSAGDLPSILLICSDTHRYDYSVAHGGENLMPGLTRLRRRAVLFDRAWSNASWTLPSIVTVLTGLPPRRHRTGHKLRTGRIEELKDRKPTPGRFVAPWGPIYHEITAYPSQLESLPEILSARGYRTALVSANPFYFLSGLSEDGHDIAIELHGKSGAEVNASVARILAQHPKVRPLFLSVHYTDVHDYSRLIQKRHPGIRFRGASQAQLRSAYEDSVRALDRHLSELLVRWDETVGLDDSLVIFYSDHGEHLKDPGSPDLQEAVKQLPQEFPFSYLALTVPVIGHGNSMQESLLRIPLVVKFPASYGMRDRRVSTPVSLVDILPTVLDVIGGASEEVSKRLPGHSLLAIAESESESDAGYPIFADYQLYGSPLSSIRVGEYKLVHDASSDTASLWRTCLSCRPDGDPGREVDAPDIRDKLLGRLRSHAEKATRETAGLRSDRNVPMEDVEKLRELGYVQ